MMTQSDFFDLVDDVEKELIPDFPGRVFQIDASRWRAELNGGWWVGYGSTRQAAIKAVTKVYNDERNRYYQT